MNELITEYINKETMVLKSLNVDKLSIIINLLLDALENEKRIFVFGNGGSGSTASHIYNDFNKAIFKNTDKRFKVVCLNDNIPIVLAIANDEGYEEVFRYQLKNACLKKDEIIIALSGSGNSKNIINAINYAKSVGTIVIGFTGYDGGELKKISDYSIDTNICNMQITEDIHLMLEHLIISTFYNLLGKREYEKWEKR